MVPPFGQQVQLSATTSLLELTCDAVVRLDASMRLEDHSPKLAAMLLRMGTSLKGGAEWHRHGMTLGVKKLMEDITTIV